jgi:hypothetical protein
LEEEEKDQKVLGITVASFAPPGVVAKGGKVEVSTRLAHVVEEKTMLMLLQVLLLFLCFYYNYNRNTRKEK